MGVIYDVIVVEVRRTRPPYDLYEPHGARGKGTHLNGYSDTEMSLSM